MSVDGGKFDLRLLRDLLDGSGTDAPDLPGNHARGWVGLKRLDDESPLPRRKSFSFSRFSAASRIFASLAILPTVLALTSPTSLATLLAFGLASSASMMRARVSGESLFVFPIVTAASRISAFLAIAFTVD